MSDPVLARRPNAAKPTRADLERAVKELEIAGNSEGLEQARDALYACLEREHDEAALEEWHLKRVT